MVDYISMKDKFKATWVSHSSLGDYIACPRSYYLKNVYRDPNTGHKLAIMNPALALGQAVHNTLEALSSIPTADRFDTPLPERFAEEWKKVSGKKGGFFSESVEAEYHRRGREMIARVYNNPGPIKRKAVKIKKDLPYFWLSEEEEIILCGKIDWLEYLEDKQAVHIIDFKTGKQKEDEASLQLPIYRLLVENVQKWPVDGASYWYLAYSDELEEKSLPDYETAEHEVLSVARKVKLARKLEKYDCPRDGDCFACRDYEAILRGEGELIGTDDFGRDLYILPPRGDRDEDDMDAEIL
jgi:ATP-dependent helicase/DNAse subunit B